MAEQTAKYSTASILLAIFCFVLPFVTFSCPAAPEMRFSLQGTDLAKGTTIQVPDGFGESTERRIEAEPLALVSLIFLAGALVSSLGRNRASTVLAICLPIIAAVLLVVLRQKIISDALTEASGMVRVDFRAGFWGALFLGAAGGIARTLHVLQQQRELGRPADPAREPAPGGPVLPPPIAEGPADAVETSTP